MNSNEDQKKPNAGLRKNFQLQLLVFSLILLFFVLFWDLGSKQGRPEEYTITYSQFMEQLNTGNIVSVSLKENYLTGELKRDTNIYVERYKTTRPVRYFKTHLPSFQGEGLIESLNRNGVMIDVEPSETMSPFWQVAVGIIPWVLIIAVWIFIMRGAQKVQGGPGGLFSFGASKAKLQDAKMSSVTFDDVAGMANAKKDLKETIEFLKDPAQFASLGAKVPKGILLFGPPGTGKTLLARAVAGEAKVPFYSISASEFIEMFVGVGASRVRDMFKKAKETQPSIIFIDEIDSVGRTRGAGLGGGHDEREQTLNQLLSELDGFEPHDKLIVIAATNRPDVLDPALLRPGRFDRNIVIDRPGWKDRMAILEVHVKDKKISSEVDLEELAKGTPGMTGAELENLANEAALIATSNNKPEIDREDFEEARDKLLMGAVREDIISEMEKKITAYHEAGHALAAHVLPGTDPLYKVSIIPRGMAMGVTQQLPEEDRHFYPKKYLLNKLCVALAGRAAEKLVFDDVSTGAQSDLKEASSLAEKMVAQWGMSDAVGPLSLGRGEDHPFLGRELAQPKHYSDEMAWLMDKEIQKLIIEAESRAEAIMKDRRDSLERLAEALMKEEIIEKKDIDRIINAS